MKTQLTRTGRTGSPRLSRTARAVRAALFASTAAAAFAVAPAAFAQSCVQTDTAEVTCTGAFTDNVANSVPPANLVSGLTLIVDDAATVDPAVGVEGIGISMAGDISVLNYGAINTDGADAIYVYGSLSGTLQSYGDLYTYVSAAGANAIDLSAFADATATLGGSIVASSDGAYDVTAVTVNSIDGNSTVVAEDTAAIGAYAYDGDATALYANSYVDTYVSVYGDATATSTYGDAYGVLAYALNGNADVYNAGTIVAAGYDNATGAVAISTNGNGTVTNYGDISATASGDVTVAATGVQAGGFYAGVYNSGSIEASATANATLGSATAVAASAYGTTVTLDNSGSLYAYAYANGYGATAAGADLDATGNLYIYNSGDIAAVAYGDVNATAIGVSGAAGGDIAFANDGSITATSDDSATAVDLYSNGTIDISNNGTLAAYGGNYSAAIDTSGGLSADYIYNAGTIVGSIYTGAGDDTVVNTGEIHFDDAGANLGAYASAAGNLFQNSGTIFATGDSYVDVGAGGGLSTSLFVNDGVIDMQDGAADDSFSVYGDFAGTGDVNVDVEGNAGVSDMLHIDGNVAADARQTINVDLLDLSAPIADIIPIVEVTGDSAAANFALGDVDFDPNDSFVNLDFGLVADIDATNATNDVFSLGIAVTGLTDTGTIAASIAPSVHSLLQTEVGTWRQRQGVIDAFNDGAVSLWARVFTEKTNFSPEFESTTIGLNGNFDWEQKNRGVEAGVDFAVTDEFSIGLLAAKSKADLDLDPGAASADIDADTWGVYGTWLSPSGFYLDTSYRWTKFDTDLDSLAGPMHIDGAKAETFNVELGYAWTLAGGLKIEPQFQWTKTNVKDLDVLTTANGMTFHSEGADSSRGRLGLAAYKGMGDADTGWRVTPYVALSAVREFDGENDFTINDTLVGRTTREGTSGLLELAVTARHEGLSIWGGVNWQDGGGIDSSIGGQLGVRYTFGGSSPAPVAVAEPVAPAKTCADLDDDADGINNCDDKCPGSSGPVGADGCPVPAPQPQPEPEMAPKPFRG
jgi:outer membrane autotransporter protein